MTEAKSPREIAETVERIALVLVDREAHVICTDRTDIEALLARIAWIQRQSDLIESIDDTAMDNMEATMKVLAEQRDTALSYAAERERLLGDADGIIHAFREALTLAGYGIPGIDHQHFQESIARHKSRLSSRPATEGKGDD